jgi:hypothetical protein
MLEILDKTNPDTHITGFNLAAVKHTTVPVVAGATNDKL